MINREIPMKILDFKLQLKTQYNISDLDIGKIINMLNSGTIEW